MQKPERLSLHHKLAAGGTQVGPTKPSASSFGDVAFADKLPGNVHTDARNGVSGWCRDE